VRNTTILGVKKDGQIVVAGDGQVSMGSMTLKPNAKKVRRLNKDIVCGFAGSTGDAFTLMTRLEGKVEEYPGQLLRSCVELAKAWRSDRYLRHLEASVIVADSKLMLEVTGGGDVVESHDGVLAIGSGGPLAAAAARALIDVEGYSAEQIVKKAMAIAADMDNGSNHTTVVETMTMDSSGAKEDDKAESKSA
jgi:ATP-dependent HslUV protease subunit HslV